VDPAGTNRVSGDAAGLPAFPTRLLGKRFS
jgi:hypothetical protein